VRLASGSTLCTAEGCPVAIVLDMDSSVSPTHGEQEMSETRPVPADTGRD